MDYKEQVKYYRDMAKRWEQGEQLLLNGELRMQDTLREFADTIETLLVERDAAIEELRGICWCCANGKPTGRIGRLRFCTTCDYMQERGILGNFGRERDCPRWQWRGPQKHD